MIYITTMSPSIRCMTFKTRRPTGDSIRNLLVYTTDEHNFGPFTGRSDPHASRRIGQLWTSHNYHALRTRCLFGL